MALKTQLIQRPPMAMFDFDHTLVVPLEGRQFPRNAADWKWLRPSVPDVVRSFAKTHMVVIVTDQTKAFKLEMIRECVRQLGVPITVVCGDGKGPDDQKKPGTRLFYEAVGVGGMPSCDSFYVGDAAGRPGDWSDKDAVFAKAIGVEFIVPETIFPLPAVPTPSPKNKAVGQEVVIMIGYPGGGKSTYIKQHLQDYAVIEGDVHKTQAKMLKAARGTEPGRSIVFDATNPTKAGRAAYITFAKEKGLRVRCIWVNTSLEMAIDRNNQRAAEGGVKVPRIALSMFKKRFEEPMADEGCEVVVVS